MKYKSKKQLSRELIDYSAVAKCNSSKYEFPLLLQEKLFAEYNNSVAVLLPLGKYMVVEELSMAALQLI